MLESLSWEMEMSEQRTQHAPRVAQSTKFTPYWLQNLTGLAVGYCFTDGSNSSADLSDLRNKEVGQAPDENLVPLYIRKSSGRGGRYVDLLPLSTLITISLSLSLFQSRSHPWKRQILGENADDERNRSKI